MKKKRASMSFNQRLFITAFLIPCMALHLFFSVLPVIGGIVISFYNYSPLSASPPFVGFQNYINALGDDVFLKSFGNTFKFVFFGVIGNVAVAILIAFGISSVTKRYQQEAFKTVYFLPTVAPLTAMIVVFKYMMDPRNGIHNWILGLFGQSHAIYWLSDPGLAMVSILLLLIWQDFGINMIILLAGIQGIPRSVNEAALIDGAGTLRRLWSITLPLIIRTIAFVMVMTAISYFQLFSQVQIMTAGGPQYATQTVGLTVYLNAFQTYRMGYASALSVILMLAIVVVSLVQLRVFRTDLEY